MTQFDEQELEKDWKSFKSWVIAALVIILLASLIRGCQAEAKLAQTDTMNQALGDSIKTWVDKEGNFKANITLLENENADYFTKWNTADSTVIQLQKLVAQYKNRLGHTGSATVITTDANIHLIEPTQVIQDVKDSCNPTYSSPFEIYGTGKYEKTKWVWGQTLAKKDSTTIGLRFHEEIDVVIGQDKVGFLGLGKPKPFAEVTLHNPFNKVSTLKAYSNTPLPVKRFGVGPTISYGIGSGFIPQVFIGIGVNWNLLRF